MSYILGIAAVLLGIIALFSQFRNKRKKLDFFSSKEETSLAPEMIDQSIIDLSALTHVPLVRRLQSYFYSIVIPLGRAASVKVLGYYLVTLILSVLLNHYFLHMSLWLFLPAALMVMTVVGIALLRRLASKHFNEHFPDALNMLASAITAGESLMHAIIYVGEQQSDSDVGREFKRMGERLQIGEPPHSVLSRACIRFPYPEFVFFSITLRANIERGGQLRDIIQQLNRVMFDARALEKKKNAMTAEARMSAKIVFAIPFFFLLVMRFMTPDNFNFIFTDSRGQYILYYVLASELVGMVIISALMRGIK
ncbi:type II secretion system F family protein [Celerinatantimonas sp. YJH-8]|uniref:type II secretion system F family protein n=1 Tax=Celerinatantimonas sp. YJH-8 TaxID=3228714 RepID=UPI0038C95EB2